MKPLPAPPPPPPYPCPSCWWYATCPTTFCTVAALSSLLLADLDPHHLDHLGFHTPGAVPARKEAGCFSILPRSQSSVSPLPLVKMSKFDSRIRGIPRLAQGNTTFRSSGNRGTCVSLSLSFSLSSSLSISSLTRHGCTRSRM